MTEKRDLGCYRDKTYCASPECKNECGRKMSKVVKAALKHVCYGYINYAYFCCEEPFDLINKD